MAPPNCYLFLRCSSSVKFDNFERPLTQLCGSANVSRSHNYQAMIFTNQRHCAGRGELCGNDSDWSCWDLHTWNVEALPRGWRRCNIGKGFMLVGTEAPAAYVYLGQLDQRWCPARRPGFALVPNGRQFLPVPPCSLFLSAHLHPSRPGLHDTRMTRGAQTFPARV